MECIVTPSYTQEKKSSKKLQLLSPAASFMITDILSKVARPDFPLNWQATEHMPKIAWKTGLPMDEEMPGALAIIKILL